MRRNFKTMEKLEILKKLKSYLTTYQYNRLKIVLSYTISNISKLVVVQTISDICKEYEDTEQKEDAIAQLFVDLIRVVFK